MRSLPRRLLPGARWTARQDVAGSQGERHFELVGVRRGASAANDVATVRAVLSRHQYDVPRAHLDDPARWATGWLRLPGEPDAPP